MVEVQNRVPFDAYVIDLDKSYSSDVASSDKEDIESVVKGTSSFVVVA